MGYNRENFNKNKQKKRPKHSKVMRSYNDEEDFDEFKRFISSNKSGVNNEDLNNDD